MTSTTYASAASSLRGLQTKESEMGEMIDPLTYHEEVIRAAHARVVNIHHEAPYDVYIGRSRSGEEPNVWANPYALDERGREVCILRYLGHVQRTKLYRRTHELKGQRLGCE